jgi:transposase
MRVMDTPDSDDCKFFFLNTNMPLVTIHLKASGGRARWVRPEGHEGPRAPRPVPLETIDHGVRYTVAQKIQALTLLSSGFSSKYASDQTGIPVRTINRINVEARKRGYEPEKDPRILEAYVIDAPRSGRPKTVTEAVEQSLLANVRADRNGREKSSEYLAYEVNISRRSVCRVLAAHGLKAVKPTRRPLLTDSMKAARLRFALAHAHWTLEDWKQVIWTDETSVILGQRRGSVRVWRDSTETVDKTCIRNRWKGHSEFMFWGSFTWYEKGPCHIWKPETAAMKKLAMKEVEAMNLVLEISKKAEWEVSNGIRRLNITRNLSGLKPEWKWNKRNGKLSRDGKGGIDWYRYWKVRCCSISQPQPLLTFL